MTWWWAARCRPAPGWGRSGPRGRCAGPGRPRADARAEDEHAALEPREVAEAALELTHRRPQPALAARRRSARAARRAGAARRRGARAGAPASRPAPARRRGA